MSFTNELKIFAENTGEIERYGLKERRFKDLWKHHRQTYAIGRGDAALLLRSVNCTLNVGCDLGVRK
jgi:hypothetical protein